MLGGLWKMGPRPHYSTGSWCSKPRVMGGCRPGVGLAASIPLNGDLSPLDVMILSGVEVTPQWAIIRGHLWHIPTFGPHFHPEQAVMVGRLQRPGWERMAVAASCPRGRVPQWGSQVQPHLYCSLTQNRNRLTDLENRLMVTKGERWWLSLFSILLLVTPWTAAHQAPGATNTFTSLHTEKQSEKPYVCVYKNWTTWLYT